MLVCYCFTAFLLLILGFFRVCHPPSDPARHVCPAVARSHATTAGGDNASSSESSRRGRGAVQQETGHCSQRNTPASSVWIFKCLLDENQRKREPTLVRLDSLQVGRLSYWTGMIFGVIVNGDLPIRPCPNDAPLPSHFHQRSHARWTRTGHLPGDVFWQPDQPGPRRTGTRVCPTEVSSTTPLSPTKLLLCLQVFMSSSYRAQRQNPGRSLRCFQAPCLPCFSPGGGAGPERRESRLWL